jgi:catechol 2,3-dioxygenase
LGRDELEMDSAATRVDAAAPSLPADLRLGPVHLTVPDVDRSVEWYRRALGLVPHRHDADEAMLGDGSEPVIVVHEDADARPAGRHAGLYHYALLYPDPAALAHAAMRLGATQTAIQGASDHGTHEAIYLADVDGNGIELAADRPRERWPRDLGYQRGPAALDLDGLLSAAAGEPGDTVADSLRVGHLHLHVGDVDQALAFYRDVLGFEEQANLGMAAFVSAGGYHHHLAFNIWRGRGVAPPPPHTIGLRHWTVVLPTNADVAVVRERVQAAGATAEPVDGGFLTRDPWETAVVFVADHDEQGGTQ